MTRFFDICFSLIGLVALLPVFMITALIIVIDSRGGVFYRQWRVGKGGIDFRMIKFRTMRTGSDKHGKLTIGARDQRITGVGYLLRRYKLDELPQLINVLNGEMSLVGPRPEVRKYVEFYTPEQKAVLDVRPGLTDYASIEYLDENEILGKSNNPEKTYIEEIMPAKIRLNMRFIQNQGIREYLRILWLTIVKIIR
jgi:lipopolysaccharide/colanic/teichoic acid biosynthesis glycosyltransferase